MKRTMDHEFAFGPVPSRRLGRSLGINNLPPKICSYACIYCQLGSTIKMQIERQHFYPADDVVSAVQQKVDGIRQRGERIDYLTFVPDGEPTLDLALGRMIRDLQSLRVKIAVITNASLLWQQEVRDALALADWVSVKVDAVRPESWRRLNRPHGSLELDAILEGMLTFAGSFGGDLMTETMLIDGINDRHADLTELADFLGQLTPQISYLAIPTRPPAESWVRPSPPDRINRAYLMVSDKIAHAELLLGYEGDAFSASGNSKQDLLSITAVHPMRQSAVHKLLKHNGEDWQVVNDLVAAGKLVELSSKGERYYLRALPTRHASSRTTKGGH
ncbi:MAG: radical SAM protein [Anaerolineales bacterium]